MTARSPSPPLPPPPANSFVQAVASLVQDEPLCSEAVEPFLYGDWGSAPGQVDKGNWCACRLECAAQGFCLRVSYWPNATDGPNCRLFSTSIDPDASKRRSPPGAKSAVRSTGKSLQLWRTLYVAQFCHVTASVYTLPTWRGGRALLKRHIQGTQTTSAWVTQSQALPCHGPQVSLEMR